MDERLVRCEPRWRGPTRNANSYITIGAACGESSAGLTGPESCGERFKRRFTRQSSDGRPGPYA
jgi:hypothetical protein